MVYRSLIFVIALTLNVFGSSNFEDIKTFKSAFVQKITNVSGKTIEYTGDVFIKNNGKVLWKYKTPIIKNVYLIKDLAIVDEPELEQAIYTKLEKAIDVVKLIQNAKKVSENLYEATLYKVKYSIAVKDNKISSLSYKDELENKVTIEFNNVIQNESLDDKIFVFFPPEEYDIIKK